MKTKIFMEHIMIAVFGVLLLLPGCASRSEPSVFYSLSPEIFQQTGKIPDGISRDLIIGLGPIELPDYLNRPQITTRSKPSILNFSEFHRWAEPLNDNFAHTLSEDLCNALSTDNVFIYPWPPQVDVKCQIILSVSRFEGILGDKVDLVARWLVVESKENRVRLVRKSRITEPVQYNASDPYYALVEAKSRAVAALGVEIAGEIRKLYPGN